MTDKFLLISKVCDYLSLSRTTVLKYADLGFFKIYRTEGGQRRFDRESLENYVQERLENPEKFKSKEKEAKRPNGTVFKYAYARVSSRKQTDDLERQISFLKEKFPDYEILSDVGSGINFKRKELRRILKEACDGSKISLAVAHKDRLARFGFDLIEFIIKTSGGEIIVEDHSMGKGANEELAEDLLSIVQIFNCRQMGKRRYKKSKRDTEDQTGTASISDKEDSSQTES